MAKDDHDSLSKLLSLYDSLQLGGSISTRTTHKELGVHQRTIQRYVLKLTGAGVDLQPEQLPDGSHVYRIPKAKRLFVSKLPLPQVFALYVALGWLSKFEGSVLFQSLDDLRRRIHEWLEGRHEREARLWEAKKFHALPFFPFQYDVDEDVLNDVVSALLYEKKLAFRYVTADGRQKQHKVKPYTLLYAKGAFYLIALVDHAREDHHPTTFHISRMEESRVLKDEPYTYPSQWDPATVSPAMTGLLGGEVAEVEVLFDARFHRYLTKERVWPEGTRVTRDQGRVRVRSRLPLSDEILAWLMGFDPPVEIVGPPELRARLVARIQALAALHPE